MSKYVIITNTERNFLRPCRGEDFEAAVNFDDWGWTPPNLVTKRVDDTLYVVVDDSLYNDEDEESEYVSARYLAECVDSYLWMKKLFSLSR